MNIRVGLLDWTRVPAPERYTATVDDWCVSIELQTHDDHEWYWHLWHRGDGEQVASGICMTWEMAEACAFAALDFVCKTDLSLVYLTTPQERRP